MENPHTCCSFVFQTHQALMWKILSNELFAVTSYFTCPFTQTPVQYWDSRHTLLGICHTFRILHPTEERPSLKKGHVSGSLSPLENTASTLTSQFSEGLQSYVSNRFNWMGRSFLPNLPYVVESVRRAEEFLAWAQHLINHTGLQVCTVGSNCLRALSALRPRRHGSATGSHTLGVEDCVCPVPRSSRWVGPVYCPKYMFCLSRLCALLRAGGVQHFLPSL